MKAIDFLKSLPYLPVRQGMKGTRPSNTELFNWLKQGAVEINGGNPSPLEEVTFPINSLVFFPKGKKVTFL